MNKKDIETDTFITVWDAIADTPEQAANLQARAELMRQIADIIKANDWKQADAATLLWCHSATHQRPFARSRIAFFP